MVGEPGPGRPPATVTPRFVAGSLLRHVVVMAGTGAIGLVAIFGVDLLNLFYLSLLGQRAIAAAIGFAGTVTFFQTSISIGMTIGVAAVVSRKIGAREMAAARRVAATSLALMAIALFAVGLATLVGLSAILDLLGASGEVRALAATYLRITSLSLPLLAIGMCCSALLRSVGDARRSMNVTLIGAAVTAALDPLLIFGLHLGLEGAAISTICSRAAIAWLGWRGVTRTHALVGRIERAMLGADIAEMFSVAGPAILTNLATPVGAAFVTRSMAQFGPAAIAGQATIDRISPVAFGLVYALSGAIGPIVAQNLGAGQIGRIREALRDAFGFVLLTVCVAWAVLAAAEDLVVAAFSAQGETAALVRLFCSFLAGSFLFTGALYVANAVFNNLGFPKLALMFNWGRATLGTIPFVAWGAAHYGARGVLIGQASGSLIFGAIAVVVAFHQIGRLSPARRPRPNVHVQMPPASSGGVAMASYASRPTQHHDQGADGG